MSEIPCGDDDDFLKNAAIDLPPPSVCEVREVVEVNGALYVARGIGLQGELCGE